MGMFMTSGVWKWVVNTRNSARKRKPTPGSRHWVNEWLVLFYYETCELI